tara:strand:+ start:125 stop:691 length:567 start_codon:yes stop_codon:yes gene_type:complete
MHNLIIILFFTLIFSEYEKIPNHFLKDLNKNKRNIHEYIENGPVAINFWFLACEPCKKEMLYLSDFNVKYSKYGFKVLSINTDNSRTMNRVKPFVKSQKYSFEILSDPKSLFFRKSGGQICPYLLLVDSDGNIINKHMGYNPGDEIKLEKEIVELLLPQINSDTTLVDTSIIKILDEISKKNHKIIAE